jgi:HK97 family phage prohead protease
MSANPQVTGYAAVFSQPTIISNPKEGTFAEQIARGAFTRTLRENPVPHFLYQHGSDLVIGSKPIGHITTLAEDSFGLRYSAELYADASYAGDLIPALAHGMGASFQFSCDLEDVDPRPGKTDWNPRGLPLRTVRACTVKELGPCLSGAYAAASAKLQMRTAAPVAPPSALVAVPARQHAASGSPRVPVASGRHTFAELAAGVPPTGLVDGCEACQYLRRVGYIHTARGVAA